MDPEDDLECLHIGNQTDYTNLDFTNCSFWDLRDPEQLRLDSPPGEIAWKVILFLPLVLMSLSGNFLILHVLFKFKQTRKCANILIGNMALADLLSTIFLTLPGIADNVRYNYPFGEFCKYEFVLKHSCLVASQLSLITLSADRLKKVMLPFRKSMRLRRALLVCVSIWIIAVCAAVPMTSFRNLHHRVWKDFIETWCGEKKGESGGYWLAVLVVLIYVPLLLMLVFYTAILCQMKKYEERLNESGNPVRSLHRKRIIQMIWVYLVVAIVCWTPLQILVFYRRFVIRDKWQFEVPDWYQPLLFAQLFFASLSPAINPLIYGVVNETFRKAITLQFPFCAKILKPRPLTTVSRSRHSVHQIRPGRNVLRSMFAISSPNGNQQQQQASSSSPESTLNRISIVLNARL